MKELFALLSECLFKKESLVLVTVTAATGSTPRGAGARMLVGKEPGKAAARLWGSIGGGEPEYLAIEEAGRLAKPERLSGQAPAVSPAVLFKKYLLSPGEAAEAGAACGGEVSVFFRSLDSAEPGLTDLVEKALECFAEEKPAWFIMELSGDAALGIAGEDGVFACTKAIPAHSKSFFRSAPACVEEEGKPWFSEPLVSGGFVYIFGGGHIAGELVPLLAHLAFRCVVFDDREEFSKPGLFPGAEKVILGDFEHIGKSVGLSEKDYAVVVTRGHLWDLEAWAFALASPAAYIGVIGSKTKHGFVKAKLGERGFGPDVINAPRVHAPIGMEINSETPSEIAVSIAAELILVRSRLREENQSLSIMD